MNNWKKKSEKLTKDVGCKEVEAEILGRRVQDLEAEVTFISIVDQIGFKYKHTFFFKMK